VKWLDYDQQHDILLVPEGVFTHPLQEDESAYTLNQTDYPFKKGFYHRHIYRDERRAPDLLTASFGSYVGEINLSNPTFVKGIYQLLIGAKVESYMIDHQQRKLVATQKGLYMIDEEKGPVFNNLGHSILNERIVRIQQLDHGALLFGTRGKGLFYHREDTSYMINETHGLASDLIRDIHESEDGTIWVATLSGISKIEFSNDGNTYQLRSFTQQHGLPTNEVYNIDNYADQVWLATAAGVVKFVEPPLDTTNRPPRMISFLLNGRPLSLDSLDQIPPGDQDVGLTFNTINYQMAGNIRYRYRLRDDAPWQYTNSPAVNYPNLRPDNYRFTVQSENEDKLWSQSTYIDFKVANHWYNSWPARISFGIFIAGVIGYFFRQRIRRLEVEQNFLKQINELERSAVQAQMNPHFVFNSLNSIQYFVLDNDIKQAAIYLSKFAQLIRDTLKASAVGEHALTQEISMLNNYLSLEKLRFKDRFDYRIEVADDLHTDRIKILTLLIQPFVENAIIHGFREIDEGGLITIRFAKKNQELRIEIKDNGIGFDPATTTNKKSSMGMSIIQRRLEMMKQPSGKEGRMTIGPHYDDYGQIAGTKVVMLIPF
ncbi:MAG: histidine kinase, partial [Bacteroidota bacterium]